MEDGFLIEFVDLLEEFGMGYFSEFGVEFFEEGDVVLEDVVGLDVFGVDVWVV